DDEHYMGGCLEASEMGQWATQLLAYRGLPPNPAVVGDEWRAMWTARLEELQPTLHTWLAHQRRDDYWRHGSVCEDYGAMECAVFMVGGWEDGYRNAILRMLEHYPGPRLALIGPWCHSYPHQGTPGPAIGFLQEALRWWDYWLKGVDSGIMDEPVLRFWMQDSFPPAGQCLPRSGRWLGEDGWPPPDHDAREFFLAADGGLTSQPADGVAVQVTGPQTAGIDSGCWISWASPADSPTDQRADDGRFVAFTSGLLDSPLEIFGLPEICVRLRSDAQMALLAARLCDVAPDGSSTLITRGVLNLCHRHDHAQPRPLSPGEEYAITLRLQAIAYRVPADHRLRLALSTTYWPLIWPSPQPAMLCIATGAESRVTLPLRGRGSEKSPTAFGPPEGSPPPATEVIEAPCSCRTVVHEVESGRTTITWYQNMLGSRRFVGSDSFYCEGGTEAYSITEDDPLSAEVVSEYHVETGGEGWSTKVVASDTVTADADAFHSTCQLEAYEGETRIYARTWTEDFPRDHV
ncbi:MAG: CocE/NonD family hydrolase, partial [Ktedonobacterales bacterium]